MGVPCAPAASIKNPKWIVGESVGRGEVEDAESAAAAQLAGGEERALAASDSIHQVNTASLTATQH